MRLALHIFRKDTRRFWWEITVTLGLLVALAYMDAHRIGFIPGPMEGWLNMLLPSAWAYLVGLVIHDEALVGDRQFWITRPYPGPRCSWRKRFSCWHSSRFPLSPQMRRFWQRADSSQCAICRSCS